MTPYRIRAPRAPHRPKRSALRRIWSAGRRRPRLDVASPRPTVMVMHGLAAFALLLGDHPALAALSIVSALMMTERPFGVLRVLWRLLVARRAMRAWGRPVLVTTTTFPALAAYRELARTGDVVAVEVTKRGLEVTHEIEIDVGSAEARRGRTG